jgi:hypothetical protein
MKFQKFSEVGEHQMKRVTVFHIPAPILPHWGKEINEAQILTVQEG